MERTEVAIIGAGVLGSAAARSLGARGVPTVLFEQFALGHARGSSHGATRIFRLSYPDPGYVRLALTARESWTQLQDDAGERLLLTTGGLDAGPDAERCAAALSACGVPHTWLDSAEVTERFPGIAPSPGERMLFQAGSGVLLAGRTVAALQRLAARAGVDVRPQAPVLSIESQGDRALLRTPAGEISAKAAIITAGGWLAGLLSGPLSRAPQLTATLQQIRHFTPRAASSSWPTLIEWSATGAAWYTVPAAGDAPGIKVGAHVPGPAIDPRTGPFPPDPALEPEAERYVRARLPGLIPVSLAAETCLYTMTPDEDFVLDREGPLVVAGGCSGHAFKFAPLLGEMLAGLALGHDPPASTKRFSLTRPALLAAG